MHDMLLFYALTEYPWYQQYEKLVGRGLWFVEAFDIRPGVVDIRPAVVADVVGVACDGPLLVSRLFDNSPLHWGLLCCLVPCRVPFAENVGCLAADNLPSFGIVAIAGGFAAMPAIAVFVLLVVPAIYLGGPKVARLYYCSGVVPLFFLLRLYLRLVWLLRLHGVYCWSSLAHGRRLKLQCINRRL